MKSYKPITVAAMALAAATFAQAWNSPEVALVLDNTNGGYQVDRFDPSTGQSLGSYARNAAFAQVLGIQQVGNLTHVFTDAIGFVTDKVYDMSTGQYLAGHIVGNFGSLASVNSVRWMPGVTGNGAYIVEGGDGSGNLNFYNTDNMSNPMIFAPGGSAMGQMAFDQASSTLGIVFKSAGVNNFVDYFNVNQASPGVATFLSGQDFSNDDPTNGTVVNQISVAFDGASSPLDSAFGAGLTSFSGGTPVQNFGTLQTDDPNSGGANGGYNIGGQTEEFVGFGHYSNLYSLGWDGTNASLFSLTALPDQFAFFSGGVGLSGISNPLDFAVYAAPEPSSLLALAPLAIGLLLRRRRKA